MVGKVLYWGHNPFRTLLRWGWLYLHLQATLTHVCEKIPNCPGGSRYQEYGGPKYCRKTGRNLPPFHNLRHATCLFFRYKKIARTTQFLLDPAKNAPTPKNARPNPFFHPEDGGHCYVFLICTRLRICELVLRIFALVLDNSATDLLAGPTSPVLGKTLEAGKRVHLPYFGDDPWFCNTFGLRAGKIR